jgi:hypothetical protein
VLLRNGAQNIPPHRDGAAFSAGEKYEKAKEKKKIMIKRQKSGEN